MQTLFPLYRFNSKAHSLCLNVAWGEALTYLAKHVDCYISFCYMFEFVQIQRWCLISKNDFRVFLIDQNVEFHEFSFNGKCKLPISCLLWALYIPFWLAGFVGWYSCSYVLVAGLFLSPEIIGNYKNSVQTQSLPGGLRHTVNNP